MATASTALSVIGIIFALLTNIISNRSLQVVWSVISQYQMLLAFTLIGISKCKKLVI